MSFDTFLGNARIRENLTKSLEKGHISHFSLISGPEGSGKHTLARLLAAAILCKGRERPCLSCSSCRKVMEGSHPDFITVSDPEHKNVPVKLVRQIREDVFIRPNESDYKIYLFPQELGLEGQNALLKILEEPPKYGVFLLLSDNPERLLPTVRSRCTEYPLQALPEEVLTAALAKEFPQASREDLQAAAVRSGGYLGQAKQLLSGGDQLPAQTVDFLRAFGSRDALGILQVLVPMEKWKRDALIPLLQSWLEILEGAMACRAGIAVPSPQAREISTRRPVSELHEAILHLKKALDCAQSNVSPAAVCGYLSWHLR